MEDTISIPFKNTDFLMCNDFDSCIAKCTWALQVQTMGFLCLYKKFLKKKFENFEKNLKFLREIDFPRYF